jgi:hypothetical protein
MREVAWDLALINSVDEIAARCCVVAERLCNSRSDLLLTEQSELEELKSIFRSSSNRRWLRASASHSALVRKQLKRLIGAVSEIAVDRESRLALGY